MPMAFNTSPGVIRLYKWLKVKVYYFHMPNISRMPLQSKLSYDFVTELKDHLFNDIKY